MSNQKASNSKFDLEAMTLEELWSLHETISGVLSSRIKAEKHELEKRLAILNCGITAGPAANSGSLGERPRRSYPAVCEISKSANFCKPGPDAASARGGWPQR